MLSFICFLLRIFTGFVFAYAGFSKLTEPIQNFEYVVANYNVLPAVLLPVISHVLPWVEWIFGVYMIVGYLPRFTSAVLGGLSLGFIATILLSGFLWNEQAGSCGCFGEGGIQLSHKQIFMVDIADLLIVSLIFFKKEHLFSLDAVLKTR